MEKIARTKIECEDNLFRVNGRRRYFPRIKTLRKVGPGRYEADLNDGPYAIEGGKACGGSSTDWFIDGPVVAKWSKPIVCTSLMDALRCLNGM